MFLVRKRRPFSLYVSRNTAIDSYRKKHHEQNRIEPGDDNDMDFFESKLTMNTLSELVSKEGYNRLVELIDELGDTYRDTIALRFILEWSNEEIADFLNVSRNTVEVRINRGRAKLIEMLGKEEQYANIQRKRP
jgi:RNA polymerase sigma-70 factor (ECF subfamily)